MADELTTAFVVSLAVSAIMDLALELIRYCCTTSACKIKVSMNEPLESETEILKAKP